LKASFVRVQNIAAVWNHCHPWQFCLNDLNYFAGNIHKTSDAFADLPQGFPLNSDTVSEGVSEMDKISAAEKIEQVLQQQISVIKEVYAYQKELSDAVRNRSWEGIERCVLKSTETSNEFLRLDKQCFLLLNQLDPYNEEVSDFYGYIALLPAESQKKLTHLYRSLQRQVQLSKIANDTLDTYVTHVQTLVQDMMDTAAIGSRTSFYTRTGAPSQSNYSSLVIDTVF